MGLHCCDDMRRETERVCDRHPDRFDCPDCLIHFSPRTHEYGLIVHDGGESVVRIRFCPWCGTRLPESLREAPMAEAGPSVGAADTAVPPAETWAVRRIDDHGNTFVVRERLPRAEAERLVAEFTAHGHKQMYWAEPEGSGGRA